MVTATPFLTQPSMQRSGRAGRTGPRPARRCVGAGRGAGDDIHGPGGCGPRSAGRPSLIRSSEAGFGPVTPATRTRITLIGSLACRSRRRSTLLFSSVGRAASVVMSCTGWLTYPPRFRLGWQISTVQRAACWPCRPGRPRSGDTAPAAPRDSRIEVGDPARVERPDRSRYRGRVHVARHREVGHLMLAHRVRYWRSRRCPWAGRARRAAPMHQTEAGLRYRGEATRRPRADRRCVPGRRPALQ